MNSRSLRKIILITALMFVVELLLFNIIGSPLQWLRPPEPPPPTHQPVIVRDLGTPMMVLS